MCKLNEIDSEIRRLESIAKGDKHASYTFEFESAAEKIRALRAIRPLFNNSPNGTVDSIQIEMLEAFKRLLDYECNTLEYWLDESKQDKALWKIYQGQFNQLVLLREKMISPEWVLQFLDRAKFDMPEAPKRIF